MRPNLEISFTKHDIVSRHIVRSASIQCLFPQGQWPCGKCDLCLHYKANNRVIQGIMAMYFYGDTSSQFITLTYNDDHLPYGLNHSHFATFMKNLRYYDSTRNVKFFVAGEYGELSGREHFHVLFFNHKYDIDLLDYCWNRGFVHDGTLTPKSLRYSTGYICQRGYDKSSGKRKPYGRYSCNLPDTLNSDEVHKISKLGYLTWNGINFSVPQIWRKRYHSIWTQHRRERNCRRENLQKKYLTMEEKKAKIETITARYHSLDKLQRRFRL